MIGAVNEYEAAVRIEQQIGQDPLEIRKELNQVKENVFVARRRKRVLEARRPNDARVMCKCSFKPCIHSKPTSDLTNLAIGFDKDSSRSFSHSTLSKISSTSSSTTAPLKRTRLDSNTSLNTLSVSLRSSLSRSPSPFSTHNARYRIQSDSE